MAKLAQKTNKPGLSQPYRLIHKQKMRIEGLYHEYTQGSEEPVLICFWASSARAESEPSPRKTNIWLIGDLWRAFHIQRTQKLFVEPSHAT